MEKITIEITHKDRENLFHLFDRLGTFKEDTIHLPEHWRNAAKIHHEFIRDLLVKIERAKLSPATPVSKSGLCLGCEFCGKSCQNI
jgi:hypothetical protein